MTIPVSRDRSSKIIPPLLVVTDLDGTFLDYQSYRFEKAMDAVEKLRTLAIPLIFNTSKTRAELLPLQRELGIKHPFIVENGSAIFLPRGTFPLPPGGTAFSQDFYVIELGLTHQEVLDRLAPFRDRYQFREYHDLEDEELVQLTGFDENQVEASRRRRYSEPLIWEDTREALKEFAMELRAVDLRISRGDRFHHVRGATDKGLALERLRLVYKRVFGKRFTVIALGNSHDDIPMLEIADWPVVIRAPYQNTPRPRNDSNLTVSEHPGPKGWKTCVLTLIERVTGK